MHRFTNYSIRRVRDGTVTVYLEIKSEQFLVQCKYSEEFFYVIPRCITPTYLKEESAAKYVGRQAKGEIRRIMVEPYEVVCFKRKKVYSIAVCFGFKPFNKDSLLGITQVNSSDII